MKNSKIFAQLNGDRTEEEISGNAEELLTLYVEITFRLASYIHEERMKLAFEYAVEKSKKEEKKHEKQ